MNTVFLAASSAGESGFFSGIIGAGLFLAIVWIIGGILLLLFPFIVMLQLAWLNSKLKASTDQTAVESSKVLSELQRQNALSRQLLRAYGHEPEA